MRMTIATARPRTTGVSRALIMRHLLSSEREGGRAGSGLLHNCCVAVTFRRRAFPRRFAAAKIAARKNPTPTRRSVHGDLDVFRLRTGLPAIADRAQDRAAEMRGAHDRTEMGCLGGAEHAALPGHVHPRTPGTAG